MPMSLTAHVMPQRHQIMHLFYWNVLHEERFLNKENIMRRDRKTRILATLGPSSDTKEIIKELVLSGADAFRLNASHGTHEDMRTRFDMIREVEKDLQHPIGILLDLQGPKLRIGEMQKGVVLKEGELFTLDLKTEEVAIINVHLCRIQKFLMLLFQVQDY